MTPLAAFAELTTAGLLIEDGPDVHRRVGRLALRLIGECMGNGPEAGPTFLLLGRNHARLLVDAYLFEVLLRSDGVSPVSVLCNAVDASQAPAREPGFGGSAGRRATDTGPKWSLTCLRLRSDE